MAELLRVLEARLAPIQAQLTALLPAGQRPGPVVAPVGAPTVVDAGLEDTQLELASTPAEDGGPSPLDLPSTVPAEPGQVLMDQLRSMSSMEDAEFGAAVRSHMQRPAPY